MADAMQLERRYPLVPYVLRRGLMFRHVPAMTLLNLQVPGTASTKLVDALEIPLPDCGCWTGLGGTILGWMAPGEYLLAGRDDPAAKFITKVQHVLEGHHALVIDLSHARSVLQFAGANARDALAAQCPLDLSDKAFPVGRAARSLIGNTIAMILRNTDLDGQPNFTLIVDQTMALYVSRMIAQQNIEQV